MTKETEKKLIEQYRAGDVNAFETLAKEGLRLSISVAKKYKNIKLFAHGLQGWLKALDHFDTEKDFKFNVYSTWWIRTEIESQLTQ